ncbi:MAG: radical SAM protein [Clostridia bacterium]|nr:radical SAM protein [Clostridia bacterium]
MKKYSRAYVEITNICNRNCSFCPGTKRDGRIMSTDEFRTVASRLRPATDYIYLHVMGEPLLHPDVCEIIRIGTSLGFKCAITTNGTLLPEMCDELCRSGLYKISISLHSFENGSEDEYTKYIDGCIDAADRLSRCGILTVLRLWNRGHDGGRNVDIVRLLRERFSDGEWKVSERGARIRNKLHLEYGDRFIWPDKDAPEIDERVFCYGLLDHFGVLADGTVIPCCLDREGVIALGNIFGEDIESILTSERAVAIADGFRCRRAVESLCKGCSYARRFG